MPYDPTLLKALTMPLWVGHEIELPDDVELRRSGDLAAFCLKRTDKTWGVRVSKFDPANTDRVIELLRNQA